MDLTLRSLRAAAAAGAACAALLASSAAHACDDPCKLAAAQSYLDALTSHRADAVPLAPDVWRIENNKLNARGAADLRKQLETSAAYRVILGLRDIQLHVSGQEVFAIYTVDAGVPGLGQLASARTFERFRIADGLITQIEVVTYTSAGKVRQPVP